MLVKWIDNLILYLKNLKRKLKDCVGNNKDETKQKS